MLGLKLNHVSKRGQRSLRLKSFLIQRLQICIEKSLHCDYGFSIYVRHVTHHLHKKNFDDYEDIDYVSCLMVHNETEDTEIVQLWMWWSGGRFRNTYELLNLRALKFSPVNKIHIYQCMGMILCVELQRCPLKFRTKHLNLTLKDTNFIQHWYFKCSLI